MTIVYCTVTECRNHDNEIGTCKLSSVTIEETELDSAIGPMPGAECSNCDHKGISRMERKNGNSS